MDILKELMNLARFFTIGADMQHIKTHNRRQQAKNNNCNQTLQQEKPLESHTYPFLLQNRQIFHYKVQLNRHPIVDISNYCMLL